MNRSIASAVVVLLLSLGYGSVSGLAQPSQSTAARRERKPASFLASQIDLDPTYPAVIAPANVVLLQEGGLERTLDVVGQVLIGGTANDRLVAVLVLREAWTDRADGSSCGIDNRVG